MKTSLLNSVPGLFFAMLIFACSSEKKANDHSNTQTAADTAQVAHEWKLMDEYHLVMAESFHPFMDSANLAPAKTNAPQLAEVAARWAEAPLPEKVNNDEVKAKLDKLNVASREYANLVTTGNDEAIGKSLTDLHHLFHEIQDAWYGAGHQDH